MTSEFHLFENPMAMRPPDGNVHIRDTTARKDRIQRSELLKGEFVRRGRLDLVDHFVVGMACHHPFWRHEWLGAV